MQGRCPNALAADRVQRTFESSAALQYVGQQQSWHYVSLALESYTGSAPRATCADWTLHFTGPSGSGKSFLAELIGNSAFEAWGEEEYELTQLGVASGGGALGGALGWAIGGPVGFGFGSAVGGIGAQRAWRTAMEWSESLRTTFRAPRPFPSQCGVLQHKFSRGSAIEEVRAWEYRVAAMLQRDPRSVIVVDDIGRLKDSESFDHFGSLLCGVGAPPRASTRRRAPFALGCARRACCHACAPSLSRSAVRRRLYVVGCTSSAVRRRLCVVGCAPCVLPGFNSVPEFRTGPEPEASRIPAGEALFVLTSDLELEASEVGVSCETDAWASMLDAVRMQSARFWVERGLRAPAWWEQVALVPFRELCADELADVVRKYLHRQLALAAEHVAVGMQ